jgi:hypothetical protein
MKEQIRCDGVATEFHNSAACREGVCQHCMDEGPPSVHGEQAYSVAQVYREIYASSCAEVLFIVSRASRASLMREPKSLPGLTLSYLKFMIDLDLVSMQRDAMSFDLLFFPSPFLPYKRRR